MININLEEIRRESINDPNKFYRKQFVTPFELNQLRNLNSPISRRWLRLVFFCFKRF